MKLVCDKDLFRKVYSVFSMQYLTAIGGSLCAVGDTPMRLNASTCAGICSHLRKSLMDASAARANSFLYMDLIIIARSVQSGMGYIRQCGSPHAVCVR